MTPLTLRHPEALAPASQAALRRLGTRPWCQELYLAGSAALALYVGHRPVRDLDLMTATNRLTGPERRDILMDLLALDFGGPDAAASGPAGSGTTEAGAPGSRAGSADSSTGGASASGLPPGEAGLPASPAGHAGPVDGDPGLAAPDAPGAVQVETARDGYLFARLPGGVGLRLFYYPYPLVGPCEEMAGVEVASAADLGLMKIAAIVSRGGRRDFVDLWLLCRELPLADLLARAGDKFGHVRDFPLQALKGLADLSGTEGEPMPRLAVPASWEEVESWVRSEVRSLGRAHAGLP